MLIFVDTEMTGLEAEDFLCSIAYIDDKKYGYELFNEGKKVSSEASSIHHITNEMIENKKSFKDSDIYNYLMKNNSDKNIFIAHNSSFDLEKLALSGLKWKGGVIDTLRVTKHLIPECDQFSLQFLRYELKLYKDERALIQEYGIKDALIAHHALSDAFVSKLLFLYLSEIVSIEVMQELSFKEVLLEKFSFGKYKGKYIEEVCINDISYTQWLLGITNDEDMKYTINYYLQGNR